MNEESMNEYKTILYFHMIFGQQTVNLKIMACQVAKAH
jgi:hypothetical protein